MTNTKGYRRGTRYMFKRDYKKNGVEPLTTYLRVYKRGQSVNIRGNGAFQKGMPHKVYHGKTGVIFNVSPHAVGVEIHKRVRHRLMAKRINVRVEHVKPNTGRDEFVARVKKNALIRAEAKKNGTKPTGLKRLPAQPRLGHYVRVNQLSQIQDLAPIPYEFTA